MKNHFGLILAVFLFNPWTIKVEASAKTRYPTTKSQSTPFADTSLDKLVAKGAGLKLISKQFSFTEGPAVDKAGNVYFTDQPNNQIWKYDTKGNLSRFMENAGRSNGMYFDRKGKLISCADEKNQLWSIDPTSGNYTVLVKDYQGKRLNGPNDVWVHPNGNIYITDPYYQREYWDRKTPDIKGEKLYCLPKGKTELVMVAENFVRPNGIIGTPDGKNLYVADIKDSKIYRFDIRKDGSLTNQTVFASQAADGMTIDNKGNIYLAGNGVTVYNPKGEKIGQIAVPAKWTANICFSGKDRHQLFITASEAVYTLQMQVKGVK